MLEEVLDLCQPLGREIGPLLPAPVPGQDLVDRHREQLRVATGLVLHLQHAQRAAAHDNAGLQRERRDHEHVERIAVVGQRLRHIAVVARVMHRRADEPIDEHGPGFLVDLVLDRVRVRGDLDDDVEVVGDVAAGGYSVEAHDGFP